MEGVFCQAWPPWYSAPTPGLGHSWTFPRLWAEFPAGKNWVLCVLLCFQHPHRLRAPADLCCAVSRQALATRRQSPEGQGCSRSGPSENVSDCSQQEGPEQSGAAVCRQCSKVTSGKSSAAPRLHAHVCACVLVHMPVGVQVHTHVCWCVCLCVSTCAEAYVCGCASVCTCMSAHMSLCMQVCACMCAGTLSLCVSVCTRVCAWAGPHTLHSSLLLRGLTGEEASAGRAGSLPRHSRRMSNSCLFLHRTIVRKGNRVGGSPVCLLRKILHSRRFWACLQGL